MSIAKAGGGFRLGSGGLGEVTLALQGDPVTYTDAATMTVESLGSGLLVSNHGDAHNLQLPTVADLEATVCNANTNSSFDFVVVAIGAGTGTVTTNTGWTLVGNMAVATTVAKRFRARKTGDAAWTLYQVS